MAKTDSDIAHENPEEQGPPPTILITGCSSGIGLTCALGMKERGWRVFATGRTKQDLEMLNDHQLDALVLDYAKPNTIDTCVTYTLWHTSGKLDALFNNGAYGQLGAVEDLPTDILRAQFEANFFGWHDLTRRLIPTMRKNGAGRIVQCSSVLGFISPPYRGAYSASKYAIEALSDAMRYELIGSGLHVSLIEPGPIDTRFSEHAIQTLYDHIDMEHSYHYEAYRKRLEKYKNKSHSLFKLQPKAVLKKLIHAVESKHPKSRYHVTIPTYIASLSKRFLPRFMTDHLIRNS
ncbi:MAG: SDR family NAD(P)-dependent oxidoreductase [Pseudomonadota bacterium]